MAPTTHFLAGWILANVRRYDRADMAAIVIAAVIPDLDGIGYPFELLTSHSILWFSNYHHVVGHNIFASVLLGIAVYLLRKRLDVTILCVIAFHLHLIMDIVGSGGPQGSLWPVAYLWPADSREFGVPWQWPLNSPANFAVTFALEAATIVFAVKRGYSPFVLFSPSKDKIVVETLRKILRMNRDKNLP